jgi:hypothetical protein
MGLSRWTQSQFHGYGISVSRHSADLRTRLTRLIVGLSRLTNRGPTARGANHRVE